MAAVMPPQRAEGTYTFASQPAAIPQRKKYRDRFTKQDETTGTDAHYGNLMYDRRVIRGNTYSQHVLPTTAQPDPIELQREAELRRRALARKRAKEQLRPRTPDAVDGRQHQDVQTELYLEELSDRVEEADVDCQTDSFLDRPPSPLFVPAKSGQDMATQILSGELFHFDREVRPILEVLVGKTLEQAALEVMEEEELASLRSEQRVFEELRNAEVVEQQRLQDQDRRRREEKDLRKQQQIERMQREKETATKIAARAFAQSYLADLVPHVFGNLADHGYFFDPVERDVEHGFLPWLMDTVETELESQTRTRAILDGLIREVVRERHQAYRQLEEAEEQARLAAEARKALAGRSEEGAGDEAVELDGENAPVSSVPVPDEAAPQLPPDENGQTQQEPGKEESGGSVAAPIEETEETEEPEVEE